MSTRGGERDEDLLRRYRQASEAEPAAPSAAVRAAILAEGRDAAAHHARTAAQAETLTRRGRPQWHFAVFGTAAAAVLAGILVLPRFLQSPARVAAVPAAPPVEESVVPMQARKSTADKADAATSEPELRADSRRRENSQTQAAGSAEFAATQPPPADAWRKLEKDAADEAGGNAPILADAPAMPGAAAAPSVARSVAPATNAEIASQAKSAAARQLSASGSVLQAVRDGEPARIEELVAGGASIEARDDLGRTPLMLAVELGRTEVVSVLLAQGANINATDQSGKTPLQLAMLMNKKDIAALLEKARAQAGASSPR